MSAPHGVTLHFVSKASGLGQSKVKSILSRHPELQDLPYSTRAGGARIFFQPFIEWLAKYEGAEAAKALKDAEVAKDSRPATSATRLPAGAQLRELRLMAEKGKLSNADLRALLGLSQVIERPRIEEPKAPPEVADAAFRQLGELFEGATP